MPPAVRPTRIKYFGSALANDFASHSTRMSAMRPMKIVGIYYLICSKSRTAPALRRAERSLSAFIPPAA